MLSKKDRAEIIRGVRGQAVALLKDQLEQEKKRFETAGDPYSYTVAVRIEAWKEEISRLEMGVGV